MNMATKKTNKKDMVTITCYSQTETMERGKALKKYLEAMRCSEGSENERYQQIYFQLLDGETECYDC